MIHILTLHFGTPAWLDIQKKYILNYTDPEKYKLWMGKYNLDIPPDFDLPDNWELIDLDEKYPKEKKNEHYLQAEWMYESILRHEMEDDDVIIFMDNDAFPCVTQEWTKIVTEALEENQVFALLQFENRGIAQPDQYHPYPDLCFFATTKKNKREFNLEWGLFEPFHQNPGFGMADRIRDANCTIGTIRRTNVFNFHNVMFGVYGNMIYHQACGSRAIIGRPMATAKATPNTTRQCYTGIDLLHRRHLGDWNNESFEEKCADIIEVNTQIFDTVYNKIKEDHTCTFIKRAFLGIN